MAGSQLAAECVGDSLLIATTNATTGSAGVQATPKKLLKNPVSSPPSIQRHWVEPWPPLALPIQLGTLVWPGPSSSANS